MKLPSLEVRKAFHIPGLSSSSMAILFSLALDDAVSTNGGKSLPTTVEMVSVGGEPLEALGPISKKGRLNRRSNFFCSA